MFSFCLATVDTDSAHVTLLTHCAALSDVLCSSSSHCQQTNTDAAKSLLTPSPYPIFLASYKTISPKMISSKNVLKPHLSALLYCLIWQFIGILDLRDYADRHKKSAQSNLKLFSLMSVKCTAYNHQREHKVGYLGTAMITEFEELPSDIFSGLCSRLSCLNLYNKYASSTEQNCSSVIAFLAASGRKSRQFSCGSHNGAAFGALLAARRREELVFVGQVQQSFREAPHWARLVSRLQFVHAGLGRGAKNTVDTFL